MVTSRSEREGSDISKEVPKMFWVFWFFNPKAKTTCLDLLGLVIWHMSIYFFTFLYLNFTIKNKRKDDL